MYLYETHLHTLPVSGCAHAGVRESIELYCRAGYAGVFITNHFIDGNINTYWHSHYSDNTNKAMPHWFMVDMQKSQTIASVGIITRQAESNVNGHIKDFETYIKSHF